MVSKRVPRWVLIPAVFGAGVAPIVVVLVLSAGPFAGSVVPDLVDTPVRSDQPAQLLNDLVKTMLTMSVGLSVAMVWLYRQPLKSATRHLPLALMVPAKALALTSIYAGLRFQFDMANQMRFIPLDFEAIQDRIYWQGGALLLQLSMVSMAATAYHLFRDRRFRAGAE